MPDVLITAAGTELHYGNRLLPDRSWERQIRYRWDRDEVDRVVSAIPGLTRVPESETKYRLRYRLEPEPRSEPPRDPPPRAPRGPPRHDHPRPRGLPRRDPGSRLVRPRDPVFLLQVEPGAAALAGRGRFRERLGHAFRRHVGRRGEQPYAGARPASRAAARTFCKSPHARGILEGIDCYDFLGDIRVPPEEHE